jgi:mycothiol synthase
MDLPAGLTSRPLRLEDARAVFDVVAAQELADLGQVVIEEADIVGDWQRPSFDVGASAVGVFDGDRLVAYAEVSGGDRGDAAVHPDFRGRGLGTSLAGWMQEAARGRGADVVGMPVPVGSPSETLLRGLGYQARWSSWVLALPAGREIEDQPLPSGYAVRAAAEAEWPTAYEVIEDAFLEWSARERQSYADFTAQVFRRPGFEPWNLRVATDPAGGLVGAAYVLVDSAGCGFVDKLAVRPDQRNRGLARALLVDAFKVAREHGAHTSELSTDSRTGALSLYEKVGMEVSSNWVNLAIRL